MPIKFEPLQGPVGAVVGGLDRSRPMADEEFDRVEPAIPTGAFGNSDEILFEHALKPEYQYCRKWTLSSMIDVDSRTSARCGQ